MPKSAKKRKEKAADFSKAKLKLGKGKRAPTNAIDTSFKARSIALPTQNIALDKDADVPTTKRKLTFDDLIAHVKHYNAGNRKDAILGLRELLETHWNLLDSSLTTLIHACVRIIGDEDAGVRKVLLAFFAWILPRIPQEDLIPHSPLLLLFATSAQTHIFPEIRIDAIRFLDIFLECFPQTVVTGWSEDSNSHGVRVLEGYLGILNAGTRYGETDGPLKATSTASVVLTPVSKIVVLNSLSTFLQHSLSSGLISSLSTSTSMHTWYLAASFGQPEAYHSFDKLLQPSQHQHPLNYRCRSWRAIVDPEDNDDDFPHQYSAQDLSSSSQWTLHDLMDVAGAVGSSDVDAFGGADSNFVAHLARTLHSTLVATFLDCAPMVFSPNANPSENELHLVMAVAQIARSLYGAILQVTEPQVAGNQESASADLGTILGYMASYFPFRLSGDRDIKLEHAFQNLNLIFCELTSLLVLTTTQTESLRPIRSNKLRQTQGASSRANSSRGALSSWILRVSEYVVELLRSESTTALQLGRPLTPATYIALSPTIWALINNTNIGCREMASVVLQATIDHALRTSSKSALKKLTIEFIARLVLLETEPQYRGSYRLGLDATGDQKLEEWLVHIPQCLWELGSNNLAATETILRFLLRILQRKSTLVHAKTIACLQSRLIPYFSITHPHRGELLGPYSKLPVSSALRRLVLDLVSTIMVVGAPGYHDGLSAAVDRAVAGTGEQSYWAQLRLTCLMAG